MGVAVVRDIMVSTIVVGFLVVGSIHGMRVVESTGGVDASKVEISQLGSFGVLVSETRVTSVRLGRIEASPIHGVVRGGNGVSGKRST